MECSEFEIGGLQLEVIQLEEANDLLESENHQLKSRVQTVQHELVSTKAEKENALTSNRSLWNISAT